MARSASSIIATTLQLSAQAKEYRPFRKKLHERRALVVGVSKYENVKPLKNAVNDATAIAQRLRKLGFTVCLLKNSTHEAIMERIAKLKQASDDRTEILFYFCGHGVQIAGINYLVPVDGDLVFNDDLRRLINFQSDVVGALAGFSNAKIFVLDACRNDPFRSPERVLGRTRRMSAGSQPDLVVTKDGLSSVEAGEETLIAFAAAPGGVSIDRIDDTSMHSPYTEAMLAHLPTRSLPLEEMMGRIAHQVKKKTQNDPDGPQIPWSSTNLAERRVVFNPIGLEPCYELATLGAVAGLITASFTFDGSCFTGSPGAGIWFGLVVAYGVWKWGRGTWWAAAISALATTAMWYLAGWGLEKVLIGVKGSMTCNKPGDLAHIAVAATLAGLGALVGTLTCAAVTSKALWSISAWSTTVLAATLVLAAIVVGATKLELQGWLDSLKIYLATAAWFACLGAALGHAFARHVPSGPNPE